MVACANTCEQMYAFNYAEKLRPREEPERRLRGTLTHTCLAYHFGPRATVPAQFLHVKTLDEALLEDGRNYPKLIEHAKACTTALVARGLGASWAPVLCETELSATVAEIDPAGCTGPLAHVNDKEVTCKPDICMRRNRRLRAGDYKVTGGTGSKLVPVNTASDMYELHWQFHFNLAIMRTEKNQDILGGRVDGYTLIKIKGTPSYDYYEHDVFESQAIADELPALLRKSVADKVALEERLAQSLAPRKTGLVVGACFDGSWDCDFVHLCRAGTKDRQDLLRTALYENKP